MIAGRVTITTAAAFLVASIAFSQMKYSRPRSSSSPTPTPTPLPLIAPREVSLRSQPLPKALPTATPARQSVGQPQMAMQRPTPIPSPANQGYLQPQRGNQTAAAKLPSPAQTLRQGQVPSQALTPAPIPVKPTPTPVPPPDVKAYLDKQVAQSKDKKFHMTVNGKDLPLTPFHVWAQRTTGFNTSSTHIDMRSDEGRIYDIEFTTTGAQITDIRIHRINGETVR